MIVPLDFPKADLKLKRKNNTLYVWCIVRRKQLVCTPEEWVRQHVIHWLIHTKNIPLGRIASEFPLQYNTRSKRADIVVFNAVQQPILIVECKAPKIAITEEALFQIAQYNFALNVQHLMLTNGLNHVFCRINASEHSLDYMEDLPVLEQN